MAEMMLERAINNAIVSTEMEGFTVTDKHRELIEKLLCNEITLQDALAELNGRKGDEE